MFVSSSDITAGTLWKTSLLPSKTNLFICSTTRYIPSLPRRISMVRGEYRFRGGDFRHEQPTTETTALIQRAPLSLREIWRFVRPYVIPLPWRLRFVAAVSFACVLLKKSVSLLPPYAFKLAVDSLTTNLTDGTEVVPLLVLIAFMGARLLNALLNGIQEYCYANVSVNNTRRFAVDIFDHLQNLSLAFHLQRRTGEITRIMDRGVGSIDSLTNTFLFTIIPM